MGWLRNRQSYDRSRILAAAATARKRRRRKKAVALYRQVLAVEPNNPDIHRKLAPLLAETRQHAEAWATYGRAIDQLAGKGFVERAIGVCRDATRYLPRQVELWQRLAELEVARGRATDAVKVLIESRRHFRGRRLRPQAVALLLQARKLDPSHFEVNFELARLLARAGRRADAIRVLEELVPRLRGRQRRRARGRLFRISPSPASAWRWLRAWLGR